MIPANDVVHKLIARSVHPEHLQEFINNCMFYKEGRTTAEWSKGLPNNHAVVFISIKRN